MKKSIIFTDIQGSGKTTKINEFVSQFTANQVVKVNPERLKAEIKNAINIETQVFVVEGVTEIEQMHEIQKYVKNGFTIYENEREPSTVYPQFIVSTSTLCHDELTFFQEDFDVIETHYNSHFYSNIKIKTMQIPVKSFATMQTSLNRLYQSYNLSEMAENDDKIERSELFDDYLVLTEIIKNMNEQYQ